MSEVTTQKFWEWDPETGEVVEVEREVVNIMSRGAMRPIGKGAPMTFPRPPEMETYDGPAEYGAQPPKD